MTEKEILTSMIKQRLATIAVYFLQTYGFPTEYFKASIEGKNGGEVLYFVNTFLQQHPNVGKPIYYQDVIDFKNI